MRRSILKYLLFTAALASVAPTLACQRRVVLLTFDGTNLAPLSEPVDSLVLYGVEPQKDRKDMDGLGQILGYYDVSTSQITVRYRVCSGSDMLAYHKGSFPVMHDEVSIKLDPGIDTALAEDPPPCLKAMARRDGAAMDSEVGGASGDDGGHGVGGAGGGGGNTAGGTGGSGAGGAAGTDGGVTDTGECGTDTHAPICDPPSGDAGAGEIPDPPTISPGCIQYCSNIQSKCGGTYDSDDACQRYCALAGWAPTGTGNTLACRNVFLTPAAPTSSYCMAAGPDTFGNCGGACPIFCAAWIGICHRDPSEMSSCVDACMMKATATNGVEPACRFQLLQRALYDARYCDYVKIGSCFSCN